MQDAPCIPRLKAGEVQIRMPIAKAQPISHAMTIHIVVTEMRATRRETIPLRVARIRRMRHRRISFFSRFRRDSYSLSMASSLSIFHLREYFQNRFAVPFDFIYFHHRPGGNNYFRTLPNDFPSGDNALTDYLAGSDCLKSYEWPEIAPQKQEVIEIHLIAFPQNFSQFCK